MVMMSLRESLVKAESCPEVRMFWRRGASFFRLRIEL